MRQSPCKSPLIPAAFSCRLSFPTKKGEWTEVELPLKDFQATWFGREMSDRPLEATQVNSLGDLLSDKKAGPFKLQIEWIKVKPTSS
jgi:NADH dehydrogenase [ubiquinone] 1 alpha subcomplex assembly factor 1